MSGVSIYNPDALLPTARYAIKAADEKAAGSGSGSGDDGPTNKDTLVNFWYLDDSKKVKTTPTYTQGLIRNREPVGAESVVNVRDGRAKVAEEHFKDSDGKYRAIVKLFLLFDGQNQLEDNEEAWPIATGWLVSKDVVVTAGHCAYDWSHGLGRLRKVRAYVGYNGYGNLANAEGQWGTAVATTVEWSSGVGHEPKDIAFIKLKSPFTTVNKLFTWTQTPPAQNNAILGVVGYPGDIMDYGERGAKMYEMFAKTNYDLAKSDKNMLQYKIDTYGGNSGSPVLNGQGSFVSIGVHVLGGYEYNSASVFDGKWGNRFLALQTVASMLTTVDKAKDIGAKQPDANNTWLWQKKQNTTEADIDLAQQRLKISMVQAKKVVADIPDDILSATPSELSFGSLVGPEISILAATAIATAGRLAADSQSASHAESLSGTRTYDGISSRALLAEAALQFYSGTTLSENDKERVEEFMAPVVAGLAPFVLKVAPRLLKGVIEPSFRLLLSRIARKTTPADVRPENGHELDFGFGRTLDGMELEFFNALKKCAEDDTKSIESFWSTLTTVGNFIGSAFKKAGPVLNDVAKIGLPLLIGAEAGVASTKTDLDPLAHRAIVAEACLQSFIQMHPELSSAKQGRFFKFLITQVKDLGPKLINVAPFAAKLVGPIVGDILREIAEKKKVDEKKQEFLDFTWG